MMRAGCLSDDNNAPCMAMKIDKNAAECEEFKICGGSLDAVCYSGEVLSR